MENYYAYKERNIQLNLGLLEADGTTYKIYGIVAEHQEITDDMICFATSYVKNDLSKVVEFSQEHNGLGFVIIHAGELGFSVLVHWWEQGSVLCQQVVRKVWNDNNAINMSARSVVACVWELGIINSEQLIWRKTMMSRNPDPIKYLNTRLKEECV